MASGTVLPTQRILLAGATGATGRHVFTYLLQNPHVKSIVVPMRREKEPSTESGLPTFLDNEVKKNSTVSLNIIPNVLDLSDLQNREEIFHGVDTVISVIGMSRVNPETKKDIETMGQRAAWVKWLKQVDYNQNITLAELAKKHGVKRYIRVSCTGANSWMPTWLPSFVPFSDWMPYLKWQGKTDDAIKAMGFEMGTILLKPGPINRGSALRVDRPGERQMVENDEALDARKIGKCATLYATDYLVEGVDHLGVGMNSDSSMDRLVSNTDMKEMDVKGAELPELTSEGSIH